MRTMVISIIVAVALMAGCAEKQMPAPEDWINFTSKCGEVQVRLPRKPETEDKLASSAVGDVLYRFIVYESPSSKHAFKVVRAKYLINPGHSTAEIAAELDSTFDDIANSPDSKVDSRKEIDLDGRGCPICC